MQTMTSFQHLIVMVLCLTSFSWGFHAPALPQKQRVSSMSECLLHPRQAADLEARAYELTRDFLERRKRAAEVYDYDTPNHYFAALVGPLLWCRRRLWSWAHKNTANEQTLRP